MLALRALKRGSIDKLKRSGARGSPWGTPCRIGKGGFYFAIDEKGCLSVMVDGVDEFDGSGLKLKVIEYMINPGM